MDRKWGNKGRSNEEDNNNLVKEIILQELSLFGESFHSLRNGYLVRETVAVDLEPTKLRHHFMESGQKFHFMRRVKGATIKQSHAECVNFILENVNIWLEKMNRLVHQRRHSRSGGAQSVGISRSAASSMALALHALQDSFSSAHTKRAPFSNANYPGAIREIFIYSDQDHNKHSKNDFGSADENSVLSQAAIRASAELLFICAQSVAMRASTVRQWSSFQDKWLRLSVRGPNG